jgi:anti-sigma B factor antagonist
MSGMDAAELVMEREQLTPKACVLVARGQIDLYSAPIFKTALIQAIEEGVKDIIVDLSDVDFMDSTGLGVLVGVLKRVELLGGSLAIVSPDDTTRRVFEIAGLSSRFEIYDERSLAASNIR